MDWPDGVAKYVLDTVDSTNALAKRSLKDTTPPAWFLAHEQTSGIGRRGRAWSTQKGNFAATYLTHIDDDLMKVAQRSFVTSLALHDVLIALDINKDRLSLKWPNDVLLDGGKLAGILLETIGQGPSHLCIGIGINLAFAPKQSELEETALAPKSLVNDAGILTPAEDILSLLACAFDKREKQFNELGFDAVRKEWLQHAAKLGETIVARTGHGDISGVFETVDQTGAVILKTPDGLREIHAAEIFFT